MRLSAIILCVLTLVSGAVAYAALGPDGNDAADRAAAAGANARFELRVKGHVNGLYPGSSSQLTARVSNRSSTRVVVRRLRAKVGSAAVDCGPENVTITSFRGHRRVPPHATRRIRLATAMSPDPADACQGARFPLRYQVKVAR